MRQTVISTFVGLALGLCAGGVLGFVVGSTAGGPAELPHPATPPATESSQAVDGPTRPEPSDPATDRPPARADRPRVVPPEPRARPTTESEASSPQAPGPPPDELLRSLSAALRSATELTQEHVDLAIVLSASNDVGDVDLTLVDLALERSDEVGDPAYRIAFHLAGLVAPADAVAALEAVVAGTSTERQSVAINLAARASLADEDTSALASALLAHDDPALRRAGIMLAESNVERSTDALLDVARSDPDDTVRSEALIALLTEIDWDHPDAEGRSAVEPVVLLAAREGDGETRRMAVAWFPDLGPVAADTALEIVREGGLDEDVLANAIGPILAAGRYRDLLEADGSERIVRAAGWWLVSVEPRGDDLRALFPLTDAVLRLDDEDLTFSALWAVGYGGELDELERIALDRTMPARARAGAIGMLFSKDLDAERFAEAERRGLRALRGVVDPVSADAVTRRRAVESFSEWGASIDDEAILADARAVLQRVAVGDPNSWVRDAAVEALEYLE